MKVYIILRQRCSNSRMHIYRLYINCLHCVILSRTISFLFEKINFFLNLILYKMLHYIRYSLNGVGTGLGA